ncbi:MAG: hypothetical protein EOP45_18075, partial [Sphingobacteriaceae bacterium]
MANLVKLDFSPLDITGQNYMPWKVDVEMHLESLGLLETLSEENTSSNIDKAKSLIFLRRHLDEGLKSEYLTTRDPSLLWKELRDRYFHQKEIMLPVYRDQWNALRFQDFKKVSEYNSAMFRIVSHLRFCGDQLTDHDMLEKTFTTFHASNVTLQQQYRVRGFTKYSELITCLLIAEKNNELLIKNHQSRSTGSKELPEVNAVNSEEPEQRNYIPGRGRGRGHGRGRGRGRGHGRGRGYGRGRSGYNHNHSYNTTKDYHKKQQD